MSDTTINNSSIPLIVDLDGTLTHTDLLHESVFSAISANILNFFKGVSQLFKGKAALKKYFSDQSDVDYTTLPYNNKIIDYIEQAKKDGRKVYLATGSDETHAKAVTEHLGIFDGYFASDGNTNLTGKNKAQTLIDEFGNKGYDYIGNDTVDIPIWKTANKAIGTNLTDSLEKHVKEINGEVISDETSKSSIKTWLKAFRIHQYAKNFLIFVPLLTSHTFNIQSFVLALMAFISFSACASAVYILNDLLDLKSDRSHATKHKRPFASGNLSLVSGVAVIPVLLSIATILALFVSLEFFALLLGYFILTNLYSFSLKRKMIIDIVVLALLYMSRIFGGAIAIDVVVSNWLFLFAIFIFASLALVKRYIELVGIKALNKSEPTNRNYQTSDMNVIAAIAAGTGMNAVTIFALYLSSEDVKALYTRPEILWLVIPVLMYWIGRVLVMANRRHIDDDPIIFALKDRVSQLAIIIILGLMLLAL